MEKSLNKNRITVLGTGTSTGIPMLGCSCSVCTSLDHRDQRMRTSIFIETKKGKKFLVDTSPDLRSQLLSNKISALDFVIITHDHADHLHGIDDLRPLSFGPPPRDIPVYTNSETKKSIEVRFPYIFAFKNKPMIGGGVPRLNLVSVELEKNITIEGEEFFFFNYPHGHGVTMGFIHDDFAYIVDCMELSPHIIKILRERKLKLLIIDCLQRKDHSTHLTVEKCFGYIREIKPEQTGLIHMGHDLSHNVIESLASTEFDESVFPLYDSQKLFY
ncbi:MAG: MBL fold metallo-hydrolase [Bdellovibrionales bacterium]|nr:MBL fold metallo-hydrolase [Bdellovibrionales bacterium]